MSVGDLSEVVVAADDDWVEGIAADGAGEGHVLGGLHCDGWFWFGLVWV